MWSSIQDYLKKINSHLTLADCLSLLVTVLFSLLLLLFLYQQKIASDVPLRYFTNEFHTATLKGEENKTIDKDPRPFASSKGKTYTFIWCQGASNISPKNKIYFDNEEGAKISGRTLSKLCKR